MFNLHFWVHHLAKYVFCMLKRVLFPPELLVSAVFALVCWYVCVYLSYAPRGAIYVIK